MQSSTSSGEIVYGGGGANSSAGSDEAARVMSEKVQMLASAIYKEFETMIQKHGQESVKELMPLVVNVLENLDLAYLEKEEHLVDLEMLKEENEQVLNQYERERQMRKNQDQKCLEVEESLMEQNKELERKVESMESLMRMMELRAKNANDHATRLEEREADQKVEYEKLHERYNDLLRTHIEHVERTKYLVGPEMFDMAQSLPVNKNKNNMAMSAIDSNVRGISDLISSIHMSQSTHTDMNLANHISEERDFQDEFGQTAEEILRTPREVTPRGAEPNKKKSGEEEDEGEKDRLAGNRLSVKMAEEGDSVSLGPDLTGMGREVENLIRENTELLETKTALNIVKNDLIARVDELSSEHAVLREEVRSLEMVKLKMSERIKELEQEARELKEKIAANEDEAVDGEDVPMAQRKRFTRVEMARVLMERNQYKEKLIELQEALKFTEYQRAKRITSQQPPNKGGIWDFFSSLFGESRPSPAHNRSSSQPRRNAVARRVANDQQSAKKTATRNYDIDMDIVQEKRMAERRQQYKAVSQHMKEEDQSRTQAYGWSIPSTVDTASATTSIPVPICCRPLLDRQPALKIWCAASVLLHGGRTREGKFVLGDPLLTCDPLVLSGCPSERVPDKWLVESQSTSLVWVCSSNERRSFVTILDANNPNCILECFPVCSSHLLCIASVPGVHESEIRSDEDFRSTLTCDGGYLQQVPADMGNHDELGAVSFVKLRQVDGGDTTPPTYWSEEDKPSPRRSRDFSVSSSAPDQDNGKAAHESLRRASLRKPEGLESVAIVANKPPPSTIIVTQTASDTSAELTQSKCVSLEKKAPLKLQDGNEREEGTDGAEGAGLASTSIPLHIRETIKMYEALKENTTAMPTMWMGLEDEYIYIHSGVVEWRKCLQRIKMADSVLFILHVNGRVFAALANGTIAVFHRDADGNWSTSGYNVIRLGEATSSICYLVNVNGLVWAAYRNCVVVINPDSLKIEHVLTAHPRKDSQVRQMSSTGLGVWLSIRLDSTIRLYHSKTYQHLQDVDIEPYITKMLGTNKLDFLHLRITSLCILSSRLWLGTGSGIILSVPLNQEKNSKVDVSKVGESTKTKGKSGPGGLIRVYNEESSTTTTESKTESDSAAVPYCNMTQAQLSFHGHKDAIRFFIPVCADALSDLTQNLETRKLLMISGGDGYIDFRLGEEEDESDVQQTPKDQVRVRDMSHLIVWEVEAANPFYNKKQ